MSNGFRTPRAYARGETVNIDTGSLEQDLYKVSLATGIIDARAFGGTEDVNIGPTKEQMITAAIQYAVSVGATAVFVPKSMRPYTASAVTFNSSILMLDESLDFAKINVQAYGAKGDGVTDDTAAFQAAIVAGGNGCTLWLGAKIYVLNYLALATNGVTFQGVGDPHDSGMTVTSFNGTVLRAKAGAFAMMKLGVNGVTAVTQIKFKNLIIDGGGTNNIDAAASHGIHSAFSFGTSFEDVVFWRCKGAFAIENADRVTMNNCYFFENQYGLYNDETVLTGALACSGASFYQCHTRTNRYGIYLSAVRADFGLSFYGGYWGGNGNVSSGIGGDVLVTGGCRQLQFFGTDFENASDSPVAKKPAIFTFGLVHAVGHIGISQILLEGITYFDNNTLANRSKLISIIDSTDVSNPSLRRLTISGSHIYNTLVNPWDIPTVTSALQQGIWWSNQTDGALTAPQSSQWKMSEDPSAAGIPLITQARFDSNYGLQQVFPRTSNFTLRTSESGALVTNTGAVGTIALTLPSAVVGLIYSVQVTDAFQINVTAAGTDRWQGAPAATVTLILPAVVGVSMTFACTKAGLWQWVSGYRPSQFWKTYTAADTTPDVSFTRVMTIANAGPVTITNFLNGVPEQVLTLKFSDVNTTINRTSCLLAGGVNYVGAVNSRLTLLFNGTFWEEQFRVASVS